MTSNLNVWLYGTQLGILTGRDEGRSLNLTFSDSAIERWGLGSTILSFSLPISKRQPDQSKVSAFFRGVLPEGQQLTAIAKQIDVAESNSQALLGEYGKDVAGRFTSPKATKRNPHRQQTITQSPNPNLASE